MKFVVAKCALSLGLAGALAACGGGATDADADGDGTITASEADAAMAAAGSEIRPEPGKYKATAQFISAEGLPAEMEQMMAGMMSTSYDYCITEEMAEQGFEEMMKSGQDDGCTVDRMKLDGSDIDMALTCSANTDERMTLAMKGTVTPTSSEYETTMSGIVPGMGEGSIKVAVSQERIGDCDS